MRQELQGLLFHLDNTQRFLMSFPTAVKRPPFKGWMLVILLLVSMLLNPVHTKVFSTQMSPRIVDTQYGRMRGLLVTLQNDHLHSVDAYLGVQYASLLDGDLRFMPPTSPMERWDTVRVFMKFKPVCPQKLPNLAAMQERMPSGRVDHFERLIPFLEDQAEECLNLNIYVPTGKTSHLSHQGPQT